MRLVGMREEGQQKPEDLSSADDSSRPVDVNGNKIHESTNWSEKEKQSGRQLEGGVDSKKIGNQQSPASLKEMADIHSTSLPKAGHEDGEADIHSSSLPKARHEDGEVIPSQFSWPGINNETNNENVIDTINHNHELQNTQSMPVWMPSVVAMTISETAEEHAFANIGDISLRELRDDVENAYSPSAHGNGPSSGTVLPKPPHLVLFLSR